MKRIRFMLIAYPITFAAMLLAALASLGIGRLARKYDPDMGAFFTAVSLGFFLGVIMTILVTQFIQCHIVPRKTN